MPRGLLLGLIVAGMFLPSAYAEDACPWLTQGTAEKLMAGIVTVTAHNTNEKKGVCTFSRDRGNRSDVLEIDVGQEAAGPCVGHGEAVTGIGTEAVECVVDPNAEDQAQELDGKVRELVFSVILRTRGGPGDFKQASEIVRQAAEQVAGNLF